MHALYGAASALPTAAQHSHAKAELLRLLAVLVRGGALGRACGSLGAVDAWEQRQAVRIWRTRAAGYSAISG
jgi:hypothetical protein